jgi:hypothetical protein
MVAESYVSSCESNDVETVLVVNWAVGGDPREGPMRTITSRSEGATMKLEDCVERRAGGEGAWF